MEPDAYPPRHRQAEPRIAALEGGVCAGKTTLSHQLAEDGHWYVVPEYVEWLTIRGRRSPRGRAQSRFPGFVRIEEEREEVVRSTRGPVLLDRSVFTLLAFEYTMWRMGRPSVWPSALETLFRPQVMIPSKILYLTCSQVDRTLRWSKRGHKRAAIFSRPDFNEFNFEFFRRLSAHMPVEILNTSLISLQSMVQPANAFLRADSESPVNVAEIVDDLRPA